MSAWMIPFRRGNDGLTDRQRARYARQWREGAGKTPTKEQMRQYRELDARPGGEQR